MAGTSTCTWTIYDIVVEPDGTFQIGRKVKRPSGDIGLGGNSIAGRFISPTQMTGTYSSIISCGSSIIFAQSDPTWTAEWVSDTPLPTPSFTPTRTLPPTLTPLPTRTPFPTWTKIPTLPAIDSAGCPTYTVQAGDTFMAIATRFGVTLTDLLAANKLTQADLTRIQIGQVLIIPVNGCGLLSAALPTSLPIAVAATEAPTRTLAPTVSKISVEVVQVIGPGDIATEGVEIRNISGSVIQMEGWILTDGKGHTFTFPAYILFPGGQITVYSRSGTNTPINLFWGQTSAVWGTAGQQIKISDARGVVQTTYTVPSNN